VHNDSRKFKVCWSRNSTLRKKIIRDTMSPGMTRKSKMTENYSTRWTYAWVRVMKALFIYVGKSSRKFFCKFLLKKTCVNTNLDLVIKKIFFLASKYENMCTGLSQLRKIGANLKNRWLMNYSYPMTSSMSILHVKLDSALKINMFAWNCKISLWNSIDSSAHNIINIQLCEYNTFSG